MSQQHENSLKLEFIFQIRSYPRKWNFSSRIKLLRCGPKLNSYLLWKVHSPQKRLPPNWGGSTRNGTNEKPNECSTETNGNMTSHAMCFNCYFHPSRLKKKKQRGKSVGSTTNLILPNQMLMLKRQKALRRQKGFISRHLRRRRFANTKQKRAGNCSPKIHTNLLIRIRPHSMTYITFFTPQSP